jgi:hypothetical protein
MESVDITQADKSASDAEEIKGRTKLKYTWAIWEHLQPLDGKSGKAVSQEEYLSNIQPIGEFDNVISFWQLWNNLPHADPFNFFTYYDTKKGYLVQNM